MKTTDFFSGMRFTAVIVSVIAAALFFLQSCKKEDSLSGAPAFRIEGDPTGLKADIKGVTESYVVRGNGHWEIVPKDDDSEWVKVFPTEGDDDGIFKITVGANEGFTAREANFAIVLEGQEQPVLFRVEQDANVPYITLPTEVVVPSIGGEFDVDVEANVDWEYALSSTDWLEESTKAEDHITFAAMPNQSTDARSVVLTVTAVDYPNVSQTVVLEQSSGSVLLDEHFDWLTYGSTQTYVTTGETRYDNWTEEERARGWSCQLLASDNTPLLYARQGFVKLGKTSYGGDLVSPKLSTIVGTVDLDVTFKAAAYISAGGTIDPHTLNIEVLGAGTASVTSFNVDNIPNKQSEDEAGVVNDIWSDDRAFTFHITGATAETQIRFVSSIETGTTNRFFLDDIKVEIAP